MNPSRSSICWSYPQTSYKFQIFAGLSSFFQKCIRNELCLWAALLKFWFQTDLGRENSASYHKQGKKVICFWLFSPRSSVGHAVFPMFKLWLVKIWQVSSCGKKFMKALGPEQWKLKSLKLTFNLINGTEINVYKN